MTIAYLKVNAAADNGWFNTSTWTQGGNSIPVNSGTSYWRFKNSPVPPSATILGAYLIFTPASSGMGFGASSLVNGEYPPGRPAITGLADANGRFFTDSAVTWTHDDWSVVSDTYTTPNLSGIVSELVHDPLYATGEALQFFIRPIARNSILFASGLSTALIIDYAVNAGRNLSWGWVSPSSCTSVGGNHNVAPYDWEPDAGSLRAGLLPVTVDDGVFATSPFAPIQAAYKSAKLLATNFPFHNIPTGSVIINGIEVKVQKNRGDTFFNSIDDTVLPASAYDTEVVLHTAASGFMKENKAVTEVNWKNTVQAPHDVTIYGSPSDTWGEVLGVDDIRDPAFGVAISCSGTVQARVDQIQMRVWYTPSYAVNSGITLFIKGVETTNSGVTLFIPGMFPLSSGITLFTKGPIPNDSGIPLNIGSGLDHSTSGFPLFVWGNLSDTGSVALYIPSVANAQPNLNLFVQSNTVHSGNQPTPLFIFASPSGTNAFERGSTLYIKAGDMEQGVNLFMKGDSQIPFSQRMNLFTVGGGHPQDDAISLFIGDSGVVGSPTLYIAGESLFEGHNPFALPGGSIGTGLLNMFIQQKGMEESVSLFIGNQTEDLAAPLFITSANITNSGITLFAPGATVSGFASQSLYSHGF